MSGLYIMRYHGLNPAYGTGGGVLYIGKGLILGADVGECNTKEPMRNETT